ncbi:MAG: GspE/PulE family protein [Selenomonas sp.]|uniref:GspE/PulE family protein n=1 Tax=Selenomonas sp. TaxID=2053611 RepID=UPI0025FAFFF7|nr:GspE/PulE family protein [Selenomonas sp.]MCR5756818.1 GspE/PulE family protein [Selenomonas sp.]
MANGDTFWRILVNECQQELVQAGHRDGQESGAIVRLVDFLLQEAAGQGASDLHIEPWSGEVRFRLRIDGLLVVLPYRLPTKLASPLISRVKVMANMDIAKHQQPQDGAFFFLAGERRVDVRVASMPVYGGEMLVLRLLSLQEMPLSLGELGFTAENEQKFRSLINQASGLIIVAGPMGSGKTTTLYSALQEINTTAKNFITLEDPIERHISGVNQVQINPKAGLSYASGLRAALRQDAQGILLGEIRDEETALLAVRMALTGHLLLTTLHTENAVAAIFRLLDMKVPAYLLAATLTGVLAQRLVRRLIPGEAEVFKGRLALHELLVMDSVLREALLNGQSRERITALARKAGLKTLEEDGRLKVEKGWTTLAEVQRVL